MEHPFRADIMHETLAVPFPVRAEMRGGQGHLVVDLGHVVGRNADFHHLHPFGKQHLVADAGGLDKAVTRMDTPDIPLIFIQNIHPTRDAEDQLEPDPVEMHHVRHRPVRHPDVACDHRTTKAAGNEVTVFHPRAADHPWGLIGKAADNEGMFGRGGDDGWVQHVNLDPRAVRGDQFPCPAGKTGIIRQDSQRAGGLWRTLLDPQAQPVAGQHRHFGVVGGKDRIQPEPKHPGVERQVVPQLLRWQPHLGPHFRICPRICHGIPRAMAAW